MSEIDLTVVDRELVAIINMALAEGHDVKIRISPRSDGRKGTVTVPMAWVARFAGRKTAQS